MCVARGGVGGGRLPERTKAAQSKSHKRPGMLEWLRQEDSLSTRVGDNVIMGSIVTPS